jgi:hypothetical protein
MNPLFLLENPEQTDRLLDKLDALAKSKDTEQGLPLWDDANRALFREVIIQWIIAVNKAANNDKSTGS